MADQKVFGNIALLGSTGEAVSACAYTGSAWPARPTASTAVTVLWIGPDTAGYPAGFVDGDVLIRSTAV